MTEHDQFEVRFHTAIHGYVRTISSDLDAVALAGRIVASAPRRRGFAGWLTSRRVVAPAHIWVPLVLAILLVAMVAAILLVGSPPRILPIVVPPVDPAAACPIGSNPDAPGPVEQVRPATWSGSPMAFDRRAGRLVVLVGGEASPVAPVETWTFDVCTNTWARMHPNREPPGQISDLVFDVDSGLTIGVHHEDWRDPAVTGNVWAYDLAANTWTERGLAPTDSPTFYDPVTGQVVADAEDGLWRYDVDTDTWTWVRFGTKRASISVYDASVDRVIGFNGLGGNGSETWRGDIRTGTWSPSGAEMPVFEMGWWAVPPSIYDEETQRTIVAGNYLWAAYDAARDRWEVLFDGGNGGPMLAAPRVFDPVNQRLIVAGGGLGVEGDLVAFDVLTREWTVLLESRWAQPEPR